MARGFIGLAAVQDWFTRRVLTWRVSITLEAGLWVETVEQALARNGKAETFNTDQGDQFTSTDAFKVRAGREFKIGFDGKLAGCNNIFIGRR